MAINFVTSEDVRILRDIELYYSTQIDEMPMNGECIIAANDNAPVLIFKQSRTCCLEAWVTGIEISKLTTGRHDFA